MFEVFRRTCTIGAGAVVLALILAPVAAAQSSAPVHNATRLGGATSFYAPPLKSAANLKQMAARKGMTDDIRAVLRDAGIPETADAVLATLTGATASVAGGSCDQATPADGTLVACEFQPGSTLQWMAYRPNARKGDRAPSRIENVKWSGNDPFKALLFRVTKDYRVYTFILPMACANLSLMSAQDIAGAPVDVSADRVCDPKTGEMRATLRASGKDLERVRRVSVTFNGQPVGELVGPSWTYITTRPGDYTFEATDLRGFTYPVGRRTMSLMVCPPPPAEPVVQPVVTPEPVAPPPPVPVAASLAPAGMSIFFDALGGKERRTRPIEDTNLEFSQCSPLIGLKLGVAKRFQNDWELAGAVGAAISLASGDDKVRESALFVDAEINKYFDSGVFLGTGLSLWDLTRGDTRTPAWLLHFGVPLARHAKFPIDLLVEGRMFFDHADDIQNNYLVWAGARVHFPR